MYNRIQSLCPCNVKHSQFFLPSAKVSSVSTCYCSMQHCIGIIFPGGYTPVDKIPR